MDCKTFDDKTHLWLHTAISSLWMWALDYMCVCVCGGGADLMPGSQVSTLWTFRQSCLLQYDLRCLLLTGTQHKSAENQNNFWPATCSLLFGYLG